MNHIVTTADAQEMSYWNASYDAPVVFAGLIVMLVAGLILGFGLGKWRRNGRVS